MSAAIAELPKSAAKATPENRPVLMTTVLLFTSRDFFLTRFHSGIGCREATEKCDEFS
jgi:hypothetical protein